MTYEVFLWLQVIIPLALYLKVCAIFRCVGASVEENGFIPKRGIKINYENLAQGGVQDVRHTFARVVFDTVYPPRLNQKII